MVKFRKSDAGRIAYDIHRRVVRVEFVEKMTEDAFILKSLNDDIKPMQRTATWKWLKKFIISIGICYPLQSSRNSFSDNLA